MNESQPRLGGKRGRPRLSPTGEPSADVHLRLAPELYDRVYDRAQRDRVSVPTIIRRLIQRDLGT